MKSIMGNNNSVIWRQISVALYLCPLSYTGQGEAWAGNTLFAAIQCGCFPCYCMGVAKGLYPVGMVVECLQYRVFITAAQG